MRPFRFSVQSLGAPTAKEWRDEVRRAEDLGFTTLHLADHFLGPGPSLEASGLPVHHLAPVPAMAAAAAATTTLRIGCRVFCVDYRTPALLAHELASLDVLSEGRLEIGLGAGWFADEYAAAGIRLDRPGERIARLEALVRALKAFFCGEILDEVHESFRLSGYSGHPRPVQTPHPPIAIGGGGPRVLALAAREANIVSINSNQKSGRVHAEAMGSSGGNETDAQVRVIREAAGERRDDIELELGAHFTVVTDNAARAFARLSERLGTPVDELVDHPHLLVGSVSAICERLLERRERYGVSTFTVFMSAATKFAPVIAALNGS